MADEQRIAETLLSLVGISTMAAASRTLMSEDKRTLRAFLRGLVLAAFVGTMVGLGIQSYNFSPSLQGLIVGISAFVADDLLIILLTCARSIRNKPSIIIDWIIGRRAG